MADIEYAKKFGSMWWIKARDTFQDELDDRRSISRQYAELQGVGDWIDVEKYKPKLDYWRPYLFQAINKYLSQPYALSTYTDRELAKIVEQLDQAINS